MSLPIFTGCIAASVGGAPPCYSGVWIEGTGLPTGLDTYALDFDGTNDHVTFGGTGSASSVALQPAAGTYAGWIKQDSAPGFALIFGADRGTGGGNADYGPAIFTGITGNKLMANIGDGSSIAYITSNGINNGTWTHVAMTWDSVWTTVANLRIYINGTAITPTIGAGANSFGNLTASDLAVGDATAKAARKFQLGGAYNSSGYFNGAIAQFGVWDVALSASDITSLQTSLPSAVSASDLIAYYDMSDGGGSSTLTDKAGNGHTGTLTNMDVGTAC